MKKRKILYITGSRADFGPMKETLLSIKNNAGLELEIIATGMHLMSEFGRTITEIKKAGFKVKEAKVVYKEDSKDSMAMFVGELIQVLVKKIKEIRPDMILLAGDRAEMMAGAVVGVYLTIPVVHIHGGDVSSTADEFIRHAITKLSSAHFAATKESAERILKMGEEKQRVYFVGAPGLEEILKSKLIPKKDLIYKYKLNESEPILLVIQHPVTTEINQAKNQMEETMSVIKNLNKQAIVIYPNADAGGREIIKVIEKYRKCPFIKIYKNIPRIDYLSLLQIASVLIGNSSSGIIEAVSFHLPVVNIGSRQLGRERAKNVISVDYNKVAIKKAIEKALYDKNFISATKHCNSPYFKKNTGANIASILSNIKIDKKFLEKKITY